MGEETRKRRLKVTEMGWAELKKAAHSLIPQVQRFGDPSLLDDPFRNRATTWPLYTLFTIQCVSLLLNKALF